MNSGVEAIMKLLESHDVVEFKDFQLALGNLSRATVFRHLLKVPYNRSYNFNGRYYTREDQARYDRFGLFCYEKICFSRDRTLGGTIKRLVRESTAGWTQRELQDRLHVRVQVHLFEAIEKDDLWREKLEGLFVYVHTELAIRERQLQVRRELIASQSLSTPEMELNEQVIIKVLLTLIRHPGSKAEQVVRHLRGYAPAISFDQVRTVFEQYDLGDGKKNCSD